MKPISASSLSANTLRYILSNEEDHQSVNQWLLVEAKKKYFQLNCLVNILYWLGITFIYKTTDMKERCTYISLNNEHITEDYNVS